MNTDEKKRFRKIIIITALIIFAGVSAGVLASLGVAMPCVFHEVTGLLCPGCGNTRAAASLMRLDFPDSFAYNPLFIPEAMYIAWVYLCCAVGYVRGKGFTYRPPFIAMDICFLAVLLAWGILRNII